MSSPSNKLCNHCGKTKPLGSFCALSGELDPDGERCTDCHIRWADAENARTLEVERGKIRKLKIIFGEWWPYYTPPAEIAFTLYCERDDCPYCGGSLGPFHLPATVETPALRGQAHTDHMDPLFRGGQDAVRNAVYTCDSCNIAKGRQLFGDWLLTLRPEYQLLARQLYVDKHGHPPEDFVPSTGQARLNKSILPLELGEDVLKRLYPEPIVSGPPFADKKPQEKG